MTTMLPRRYSEEDEKLMQALTPPEEDRHLFTRERWSTGFRWFRTPNVICLEHYRPLPPSPKQPTKAAR
jgi:hypothetical protein